MKTLTLPGLVKTFQDYFGSKRGFDYAGEGANPSAPGTGFRTFWDADHLFCVIDEDEVVGQIVVEREWDYGEWSEGPTHDFGDAGNGTLDFRGHL